MSNCCTMSMAEYSLKNNNVNIVNLEYDDTIGIYLVATTLPDQTTVSLHDFIKFLT